MKNSWQTASYFTVIWHCRIDLSHVNQIFSRLQLRSNSAIGLFIRYKAPDQQAASSRRCWDSRFGLAFLCKIRFAQTSFYVFRFISLIIFSEVSPDTLHFRPLIFIIGSQLSSSTRESLLLKFILRDAFEFIFFRLHLSLHLPRRCPTESLQFSFNRDIRLRSNRWWRSGFSIWKQTIRIGRQNSGCIGGGTGRL